MAKSFACQTFREVTATAQQIFGGNGFTVEFDIQLFFRRAKSLQLNNWDDRYLNELIAAAILDHSCRPGSAPTSAGRRAARPAIFADRLNDPTTSTSRPLVR